MAQKLKQIVLDAHQRGALIGLHIDLQSFYCTTEAARQAFTQSKHVSEELRRHGAQNIWGIWPLNTPELTQADRYKASDLTLSAKDNFAIVAPSPNELVYTKFSQSLRENRKFRHDFANIESPVFTLTGATSDLCMRATALGIIDEFYDAQVIFANNAISPAPKNPSRYLKSVRAECEYPEDKQRLHEASAAEITQTLDLETA